MDPGGRQFELKFELECAIVCVSTSNLNSISFNLRIGMRFNDQLSILLVNDWDPCLTIGTDG